MCGEVTVKQNCGRGNPKGKTEIKAKK